MVPVAAPLCFDYIRYYRLRCFGALFVVVVKEINCKFVCNQIYYNVSVSFLLMDFVG